jgi:hypothetical protein
VAKPEPLAVIDQKPQCTSGLVYKDKHGARERIIFELLAAYGCQAVNSFSEIYRACGHQYPHMWSKLDHDKKASRIEDICGL